MDNPGMEANTSLEAACQSGVSGGKGAGNTFTDVQEPVVAAQKQESYGQAAKTAGLAQSVQNNKAAKAARLQAEAETAKKIEAKYREDIAALGITDPDTGQAVTTPEALYALLREQNLFGRVSAEEAQAKAGDAVAETGMEAAFSAEQMQLQKLEAENSMFRRLAQQHQFADDLAKIKEQYPKEAAETIFDLGETFFTLRRNGIALQTAYEASRAEALRNTLPAPAAIGAVNGNPTTEKDFYTPAEVDRLTEKDFKRNPRLLEKVQKSMRLWQ